ncbi:ubiquitin carboxyl-terminal hydrolase 17-like protein A isoform X2 [Mus pahari]|uniref:ubiquitin carboxyl-terminal hydrolase 17-like protein A isoform X2 n=1 Tax=Mus pahari TaxID=10093 RepID=UPI000A305414|nr:ubiquitin carboxyl-terminal hydrolase 17-like protein A isoform X2 [Mus pahari]
MVVASSFPEADPALSSPGAPELYQDETQVVEVLAANGKHSLSWESPQGPGCGLQNTGNSCYLNAALQCLTHTPPLADYMLSQEHTQTCCSPEGCKMCAMEAHVTQSLLYSHSMDVMKPSQILTSAFHKNKQEDAHEFLMFTLTTMHESCLRGLGRSEEESPSEDSSPIHDIFGGCWRSQIKCLHCQGTSDTYDPFLDVPLDISSAHSVKQALWDTEKVEELCGENAYYCGRCRQKMPASKSLKVYSAPKVLLLVLKRFSDFMGNKLDRKVSYPEFLDLKPYLSQPTHGPLPYALYAVLVHDGATCDSGHYFCCVKAGHGKWYKMDDTKVTRCDVTSVLNENAYVLFYVQQTDLKQISIDMSEDRVHEVLDSEYQVKTSRKKKHKKKKSPCTEDVGEPWGNRENRAIEETSLGEEKVLQEQNHQKAGQNHRNTEIVPQEQNYQKAGQNLRTTEHERDLPADATVIHQPRSTANWCKDAPDKENQPWNYADRLFTSQGPENTRQLCSQGGRRRSKKGKNKNKQGQRLLIVC